MDSPITRAEHNEFMKRMEEEHTRQNHRICNVEKAVEQNNKLLISVEKLALSMEGMQKEQSELRNDVDEIKNRDGQKWRKTGEDLVKILLSLLMGYIFAQIGIS